MAKSYVARLLMSEFHTHDVKRFVVSRPDEFSFQAGQGVELSIHNPESASESRPFTPTSLGADQFLEFTIKAYPDHKGVTEALHKQTPGTALRISEPFGTISYKGPGVFIAGGKIRDFDQNFYVCGPPGFMKSVNQSLEALGAKPQSLVFER